MGEARVPPLIAATLAEAERFLPSMTAALSAWYTERQPALLAEQLTSWPAAPLLHRRLEPPRVPRLAAALEALATTLGPAATAHLGFPDASALLAARPTPAALYAASAFGPGVPMLGAGPTEQTVLAEALAAGADPDALLNDRLAAALVHELCHGPAQPLTGPPAPWMITEAAAALLGWRADPRHLLPAQPGEALPAAAPFLLLGLDLAARFGEAPLFALLSSPCPFAAFEALAGPTAARALAFAEWQDFARRAEPPLYPDGLRAAAWARLLDAALAPSPLSALAVAAAEAWTVGAAPDRLPNLLDAAAATPCSELPAWSRAPTAADLAFLAPAVASLMQVHVWDGAFTTRPADPPDGLVQLDVAACRLHVATRPDGLWNEPASAPFPPPLARRLADRGHAHLTFSDVTASGTSAIIARLHALTADSPEPP